MKKLLLFGLLSFGIFASSFAQDAYIGEIRMFAGNFAPNGWAFCNGQILAISQNTALFSLLGTTYGGNGVSTFALPDLRSRVPIHFGQGPNLSYVSLGEMGGAETVTVVPFLPVLKTTGTSFGNY